MNYAHLGKRSQLLENPLTVLCHRLAFDLPHVGFFTDASRSASNLGPATQQLLTERSNVNTQIFTRGVFMGARYLKVDRHDGVLSSRDIPYSPR
jgi:hypothetical protein